MQVLTHMRSIESFLDLPLLPIHCMLIYQPYDFFFFRYIHYVFYIRPLLLINMRFFLLALQPTVGFYFAAL